MSTTEAQTRKEIIDLKLRDAGWDVTDCTQVVQEFGIRRQTATEVQETYAEYGAYEFSDYVLLGRDGKPLAVVEAKKTSRDAEVGREQAKQYCYHIQQQYNSRLPFCFYTNGHDIYFWNIEQYPPKSVIGFPTRDDLERCQHIRDRKKPLARELINTNIAGRDYQIQAIRSVMEAIEKKQSKFLLVMATGTGKTRTAIALVDVLMRAGWVERVLFLVDRIALREQALAAFKEHLPNEPRWPKLGEKSIAKNRRIYVSTYPAMLNIIHSDDNPLSPHFFDLIIVDESHRSIYNVYQEIVRYFSTLTLGLTATPTDAIDHNTFQLFNCDDGMPTFAYSYHEAVTHQPPYLRNFQVMKIHTRFQDHGISKRTISLEDQKKLLLEGKDVEEIHFEGTELEKTVTNRGTNALIVKQFMEECIKDPHGVLPGKTIFFCSSIAHARRIERIFDALYPEYCGELAKVLVSDDPKVYGKGGLLDQFANADMPRVAISVDMLDTGIDVREVVNLVFARPVYSYTKFWQMIGRGTRLLDEFQLKPWCPVKDLFLIMDCWDNFEYFKLNPTGRELKAQLPLPVRFVGIRIDKIEQALQRGRFESAAKEIRKLRAQIVALPHKSVVITEAAADLAQVRDDAFWNALTPEQLDFLRQSIKPLFRTVSQADFQAMRFEKDVLETSLAYLMQEEEKFEVLKDNVTEQIGALPLSVNIVAREEELIRRAQTNTYWATVTDDALALLAETLAPLMKFREQVTRPGGMAKFDLQDLVTLKDMVEFGPEREAVGIARYREMVEARVLELTYSNPVLQKLKSGEAISQEEAAQLAELLHDQHPHITEELLRRVYHHQKATFLQFIRHILGLELLESFPDSVARAFDQFIQTHTDLTARQLEFLALLREYIIERGTLQKRDLIQTPFTIIHPHGIRGVFAPALIDEILELTDNLVA